MAADRRFLAATLLWAAPVLAFAQVVPAHSPVAVGVVPVPPVAAVVGDDLWANDIYVDSRASVPLRFQVVRPDGASCTGLVTATQGNRIRVHACGAAAVILMHDGVEETRTPVTAGGVYEIYADGGRWKIRAVNAY